MKTERSGMNRKLCFILLGIGVLGTLLTPAFTPPALTLAHTVSSILEQHFYTRPEWAGWLEFALILLIVAYLAVVMPRLGPGLAALISLGLVVAMGFTEIALLSGSALWLKLMLPLLTLPLAIVKLSSVAVTPRLIWKMRKSGVPTAVLRCTVSRSAPGQTSAAPPMGATPNGAA